jgi:hypothetical protein
MFCEHLWRRGPCQICATLVLLTKRASNVDIRWIALRMILEFLQASRHPSQRAGPCAGITPQHLRG